MAAVDFARELDEIRAFLAEGGFRLAIIGGVAVAAYGHPRMTLDVPRTKGGGGWTSSARWPRGEVA
jgi:hypothetical protein